jgi:hypothetical protein
MSVSGRKMMLNGKGNVKPEKNWKPKPKAATE